VLGRWRCGIDGLAASASASVPLGAPRLTTVGIDRRDRGGGFVLSSTLMLGSEVPARVHFV
jgi:hypothetical protein